jgi:hypothetical protein
MPIPLNVRSSGRVFEVEVLFGSGDHRLSPVRNCSWMYDDPPCVRAGPSRSTTSHQDHRTGVRLVVPSELYRRVAPGAHTGSGSEVSIRLNRSSHPIGPQRICCSQLTLFHHGKHLLLDAKSHHLPGLGHMRTWITRSKTTEVITGPLPTNVRHLIVKNHVLNATPSRWLINSYSLGHFR